MREKKSISGISGGLSVTAVIAVFLLFVGLIIIPSSANAGNGVVREPDWGNNYTLNIPADSMDSVCYAFSVGKGDTVYVNTTNISVLDMYQIHIGSIANWAGWPSCNGVSKELLYSDASNGGDVNNYLESDQAENFWVTSAVDQPMAIRIYGNADASTALSLDYTIERVNATSGLDALAEDISALQEDVSDLTNVTTDLQQNITDLWIELGIINDSIPDDISNISNITDLQNDIDNLSMKYEYLSDNISRLDGRIDKIDGLDIPEDMNLTEVQKNITALSNSYSYLSENLTRLEDLIDESTTYVYNNKTIYAYDNETLAELEGNIQNNLLAINDLEESIGTGGDQNITKLTQDINDINKELDDLDDKKASETDVNSVGGKTDDNLLLMLVLIIGLAIGLAASHVSNRKRIRREVEGLMADRGAEGKSPPQESYQRNYQSQPEPDREAYEETTTVGMATPTIEEEEAVEEDPQEDTREEKPSKPDKAATISIAGNEYTEGELLSKLSSLPRGLPSEFFGKDPSELAEVLMEKDYYENEEGDIIFQHGKKWYYGNPDLMGNFMQRAKRPVKKKPVESLSSDSELDDMLRKLE